MVLRKTVDVALYEVDLNDESNDKKYEEKPNFQNRNREYKIIMK
jgi:hypothetical protein